MTSVSITCRTLPADVRPRIPLTNLVTADESAERLRQETRDVAAQAALWAAVAATHAYREWPLLDLRSRGARGTVKLLDHWFPGGDDELRGGFLELVMLRLMEGEISGLRFTASGLALVTT